MDGEQGALGVVLAAQHETQLELLEQGGGLLQVALDVGQRRRVGLAPRQGLQLLQLAQADIEAGDRFGPDAALLDLGQDATRRRRIVPEAGGAALGLERRGLAVQAREIKDTP
jgi:hypothetical protein